MGEGGLSALSAVPAAEGEFDVHDQRPLADVEADDAPTSTDVTEAPPWAFEPTSAPTRRTAHQRDSIYRRSLAIADVAALSLALFLGVVLVDGAALSPYVLLAFPALVVLAKVLGLYDRDQHLVQKSTLDELPKLLEISILVAFCASLLQGPLVDGMLTAPGLLVFASTLFLGLAVARSVARAAARRLAAPERCVIVGDPSRAEELAATLAGVRGTRVEFIGSFDELPSHEGADHYRVREFLIEQEIDRVVLAPGNDHRGDMLELVGAIKSLGVKISVLPSVAQAGGTSFELDRIDGVTLLGVRGFEFSRSSMIVKRAMDLAISSAALVLLSPLMLAIAIAIKVDSRGPVFYRQTRIGRHEKPFRMLKFRTMVEDAHTLRAELDHLNEASGGLFKISDDPRVTRIGRHLRSLSIDEIPQLLNVVRGEMSLVGPRPLLHEEDRLVEGWHRQRLSLTPGITGHWQVLGSARVPLEEMVKLDYSYVQNWSAWNDIQLLLRTIPFVLARRGM